jgi:hypothetical protein
MISISKNKNLKTKRKHYIEIIAEEVEVKKKDLMKIEEINRQMIPEKDQANIRIIMIIMQKMLHSMQKKKNCQKKKNNIKKPKITSRKMNREVIREVISEEEEEEKTKAMDSIGKKSLKNNIMKMPSFSMMLSMEMNYQRKKPNNTRRNKMTLSLLVMRKMSIIKKKQINNRLKVVEVAVEEDQRENTFKNNTLEKEKIKVDTNQENFIMNKKVVKTYKEQTTSEVAEVVVEATEVVEEVESIIKEVEEDKTEVGIDLISIQLRMAIIEKALRVGISREPDIRRIQKLKTLLHRTESLQNIKKI